MKTSPVTLSLFSGAGGLDLGFHRAGFNIVSCVEVEEVFTRTLQANVGKYLDKDCQIINHDIRTLSPQAIDVRSVDFIIGGPPCQSFSAIGRRAGGIEGTKDERGGLFEHYCRLVQHFKPRGFLFENVRGILGSNNGKDWALIVDAFQQLGYELYFRVLDTADYGVPQHRERLILVGSRDNEFTFLFPRPTHGQDSSSKQSFVSALSAIEDLQDPLEPFHNDYGGKYGHLLTEVPEGQNYLYFTKEMGHPNPSFAWRSRFSDFLYKADRNQPVRTIVAKLGRYSGPFHWKNRKMTFDEMKRLQSFPDDYEFVGGEGKAMQQLGNSVPPLFAYHLALAVKMQFFGTEDKVELVESDFEFSFDLRKREKAKKTHKIRATNNNRNSSNSELTAHIAFAESQKPNSITDEEMLSQLPQYNSQITFYYRNIKLRETIEYQPLQNKFSEGNFYRFQIERKGKRCSIYVYQRRGVNECDTPLIKYQLNFKDSIGDNLQYLECTLFSFSGDDIAVAWDAIEDYISSISGYQTMMDIYGHFTEPHPIFDLKTELLSDSFSFVIAFAYEFSSFHKTRTILQEDYLRKIYDSYSDGTKNFDLAEVAFYLRSLRFDVRVNETNRTIQRGYFRCCYPFTLNINKQHYVTWRERAIGE